MSDETDLDLAKQALRAILQDAEAPAAARSAAARTMLELVGALGKHAPAPASSTKAPGEMTREELERELAGLRADDLGTD